MMKTCSRCSTDKPVSEFSRQKQSKDGLQAWCNDCVAIYRREWFARNPERKKAYSAKINEVSKLKYATDETYRQKKKEIAARVRARASKETKALWSRRSRLKREYGLTIEDFNRRAAIQNNRCACCNQECKQLLVDHDHQTGAIRGLLCPSCNVGIGLLGDDVNGLQRAISYLQGTQQLQPLPFIA